MNRLLHAVALISLMATITVPIHCVGGFAHGWTTVQGQMWGWLGGDYEDSVSNQLEWFALNYGVIVIGQGAPGPSYGPNGGPCHPPEPCHHNQSYAGQFLMAKQLKQINPSVKVLLYEASGFGALGFGQAEFAAHPEWCLTDDNGVPYNTVRNGHVGGCEMIDWRKQEVRDWWVTTANQTGEVGALFDGLLVDSAGPGSDVQFRANNHTVSNATIKTIMQAKMDMLGEATKFFNTLNDGFVIGNPTLEWDVIGPSGGARGGPFPPTYHWNYLRGSLDEMFGAFGTQTSTGEWNRRLMRELTRPSARLWNSSSDRDRVV